jgi:hypothetical protein
MGIITPADATPVNDAEIAKLNADHHRFILGLVVAMLALVVIGLTLDVISPPSSSSAVVDGVQKPPKK